MSDMQKIFNSEAILTPNYARLLAIKANSFWQYLAAARTTLLSLELLCKY